MEILIEFLLEVVFQIFFDVLGMCFDGATGASSRYDRAVFKIFFYTLLGGFLGLLSVGVWPQPLYGIALHPLVGLLAVPVAVGAAMVVLSKLFEKKWDWDIATDRFGFSVYFAFVFAIVRYTLTHP